MLLDKSNWCGATNIHLDRHEMLMLTRNFYGGFQHQANDGTESISS